MEDSRNDRLDANEGKPWSDMDLFDLRNSMQFGTPPGEIATFLCRTTSEVREKIAELTSGEAAPAGERN